MELGYAPLPPAPEPVVACHVTQSYTVSEAEGSRVWREEKNHNFRNALATVAAVPTSDVEVTFNFCNECNIVALLTIQNELDAEAAASRLVSFNSSLVDAGEALNMTLMRAWPPRIKRFNANDMQTHMQAIAEKNAERAALHARARAEKQRWLESAQRAAGP